MAGNVEARIEGRKVTYGRHFDGEPGLAFEAWSSPEHVSRWWGPDGFTLTTKVMEFRDGGTWEFVMHGPDGHDYRNKIRFVEIRAPHHIHYLHLGDGEGDANVHFEAQIVFEKNGSGTDVTMVQTFPTKEELDRVNTKYGAIEGGKQHLAKFGRYLDGLKRL